MTVYALKRVQTKYQIQSTGASCQKSNFSSLLIYAAKFNLCVYVCAGFSFAIM